jgi:hypothetical protein
LVNLPLTYTPISGPSSTEYLNLHGSFLVGWIISKFLILPFIISKLRTPPTTAPPGLIEPAPKSKFPPPVFIAPPLVVIPPPTKSIAAPLFN